MLERAGYSVVIEKVVPSAPPLDLRAFDAVGFSLSSSATYGHMLQARRRSLIRSDALVMVGGVHCNFYPQTSLTDFDAHVAAIGESEDTILDILDHIDSKMFDGVSGTLWRDGASLHGGGQRPLIPDIDTLPLPARHLLPVDDFLMADRLAGTSTRMVHVMFSRGCPFPCNFCAAGQTKIQYRSGESARMELIHLMKTYAIEGFAIVDDNFVVDKKKVANICRAIVDLKLRWSALSRVDTINESLLQLMAEAGCIEIKYGMESGSEKLLKAMKKNTTREQIKRAIRSTKAAGIHPKVFLIHGFPGENHASTAETITLLKELSNDIGRVSLFRFVPLPGTEVYERAAEFGIRGTHLQLDWDGDWSKFHIHHNTLHWWGSKDDWTETEASFETLRAFVEERWGSQG